MVEKDKGVRNTITFPTDLYEKLKLLAEKEHRSISQQVIKLCEQGIAEAEKANPPQ